MLNMMNDKCTDLFRELKIWADEAIYMYKFVEYVKEWIIDWNKGNIRIALINLHELGKNFPDTDLFIAFDDCGGGMNTTIKTTFDFIDYFEEILNDAEDLPVEEYWVNALTDILND